jgi:UDP-N-acetylmuramoylalanine--D-glutamate ligase
MGESAEELERLFRNAGLERIERAATMDEAVRRADAMARAAIESRVPDVGGAGEAREAVVLLSPAAASFDMFEDYAARGAAFKAAVQAIVAGDGTETSSR